MLPQRSIVHYDTQARRFSPFGGLFVDHTVLHPDVLCAYFDGVPDNEGGEVQANEQQLPSPVESE